MSPWSRDINIIPFLGILRAFDQLWVPEGGISTSIFVVRMGDFTPYGRGRRNLNWSCLEVMVRLQGIKRQYQFTVTLWLDNKSFVLCLKAITKFCLSHWGSSKRIFNSEFFYYYFLFHYSFLPCTCPVRRGLLASIVGHIRRFWPGEDQPETPNTRDVGV